MAHHAYDPDGSRGFRTSARCPVLGHRTVYFIGKPFIKIITGLRRSGKSELLKMLRAKALNKTDESHIIYINFEDADYQELVSSKELNAFFKTG